MKKANPTIKDYAIGLLLWGGGLILSCAIWAGICIAIGYAVKHCG